MKDRETTVCISCRHQLPVTNYHYDNNDAVKKVLYGRVQLQNATALLHFTKKGIVQQLMHNLKYRGHEQVGGFFGKWLGGELKNIDAYKSIDVVVPVPLYKTRLRERGYNQVEKFGRAIAKALDAEYNDRVLIKTKATRTQVFKGRLTRSDNEKSVFDLSQNHALSGKHILLVDDIITTGATVESCASVLLRIDNIKLSLATMAIAD
ncbi:ComF family protein [Winogradskyella alexanderae]|uniref:ComF family protein n=1 Tax=Winogradskyella alexanderae TaxID=2877123 RepID=UPI0021D441FC|nr:ComF family protein [Winogradskyella alexanderae]